MNRYSKNIKKQTRSGCNFSLKKWQLSVLSTKPLKSLTTFLAVQHSESPKLLPLWTFIDHRTGGSWSWNMNVKCSSRNIISLKERLEHLTFTGHECARKFLLCHRLRHRLRLKLLRDRSAWTCCRQEGWNCHLLLFSRWTVVIDGLKILMAGYLDNFCRRNIAVSQFLHKRFPCTMVGDSLICCKTSCLRTVSNQGI